MIKTICFDWGNTLCHVTGEYKGPMIDWPEIHLVDGAREAIDHLGNHFGPLYIATNAKDSSAAQVQAVMERLALDTAFAHIFLPAEIGCGKEEVGYYRKVAEVLGEQPANLLMIGDDYQLDIVNAWRAGWQTAYFNVGKEQSNRPMPLQQFEAITWKQLIEQLAVPRPSVQTCFAWLQESHQTLLLMHHVQLVAAIAYWLAQGLMLAGEAIDPILAHRAALVHDLDKLDPDRPADMHGAWGADEIARRGFTRVADIVRQHVPTDPALICFSSREAELVFFADKLAKGNLIVSIQERYDDLTDRYPSLKKHRKDIEAILYTTQDEVSAVLGIPPDHLVDTIHTALGFW